jgi:Mg-chelatase subunit ChlD
VCALLVLAAPASARADQLDVEVREDEPGYQPVQELSYEVFVDTGSEHGYAAQLKLRIALHNGAASERDAVHTVALPRTAELVGLSVATGGEWKSGGATVVRDEAGRRDPGTVWVRPIEPDRLGGLPGAEIVAYGLRPDSTVQVELTMRVVPSLRAGRWEIDLPARGNDLSRLAADRRVLVRGLPSGQSFWVDDSPNGDKPVMVTAPSDTVTVAWPARFAERGALVGRYDTMPGPAGFDDGRFRIVLRVGESATAIPDHVVFVLDRSRSTAPRMHREALRVIEKMLDALPASTTWDAIGFARTTEPLLATAPVKARDAGARRELAAALDANRRHQGTDLAAALAEASRRAQSTGKKKKPLVVVITDGMLPSSMTPASIRRGFDDMHARGRLERPDVLFIVDDPLFERGLSADHPVAAVAAELGARIGLKTLSEVPDDGVLELLAAPRVLGDLDVALPPNMLLDRDPPAGLVAGSVAVLQGHYLGKAASRVVVRGRASGKKVQQKLKAHRGQAEPAALVAVTAGTLGDAVAEGFVRPSWHRSRQQRIARQGIAQSGRRSQQRGYLDDKIFRNYLTTRVLPRARVCYNHAVTRDLTQGGRVVLEMEVGKGEVMAARVKSSALLFDDATLVACLTEAAWALDVPAGKLDDSIYVVRYPLVLTPPKSDRAQAKVERNQDEVLQILLGEDARKQDAG